MSPMADRSLIIQKAPEPVSRNGYRRFLMLHSTVIEEKVPSDIVRNALVIGGFQ